MVAGQNKVIYYPGTCSIIHEGQSSHNSLFPRPPGQANNVNIDKVRSCRSHRLLSWRHGSAVDLVLPSGNTFSGTWTSTRPDSAVRGHLS